MVNTSMMQSLFAILCLTTIPVTSWSQTCGPRVSPRLMNEIPCDMTKTFYCQVPGPGYPWSSVRRYIYENQGLMRRMYGDQRQSFVVRNEIEDLHEKYDFSPFNGRHIPLSSSRKSFPKFTPRSAFSDSEPESQSSPLPSQSAEPLSSSTASSSTISIVSTSVTDTATVSPREEKTVNVTSDPPTETTNISESLETTTVLPAMSVSSSPSSLSSSSPDPIIVPLPSSTSSPEEAPVIDETKKGFNACPVKEEVVAPYWANNTRGEILALLNVYPFEQYVHWEKCQFELNQMYCRDGCRCEQQYRLHRLLAFDPKNECRGIFADWFRFPSSCTCVCYDISLDWSSSPRSNQRKSRL